MTMGGRIHISENNGFDWKKIDTSGNFKHSKKHPLLKNKVALFS